MKHWQFQEYRRLGGFMRAQMFNHATGETFWLSLPDLLARASVLDRAGLECEATTYALNCWDKTW